MGWGQKWPIDLTGKSGLTQRSIRWLVLGIVGIVASVAWAGTRG